MRIGIVTTWFERGASHVSKLYRNVLRQEHDVYIFARGGESYDYSWGDEYVTFSKHIVGPVINMMDLDEFKNWLVEKKIEIVFFNEEHWWEPVRLANKLGVKTGAYIDYYTKETVELFNAYDFLICNTKRHYSVFKNHPQAYYVPWGTDTSIYKPSNNDNKELTFFHSAGYNPQRKGTNYVIKAFNKLNEENIKLIIHTQVDIYDEKFYPDVEELKGIVENSNGKIEVIKETVPQPGLYYLGDIYVYPSILDGVGLTVAEALSSGLPVITTDAPPMNEFVNDMVGKCVKVIREEPRKDGYFWPLSFVDVDDLVDKMEWFVKNIKQVSEYKRNARKYALERLDWNNNTKDLPNIFSSVKKIYNPTVEEKIIQFEKKRYDYRMILALRFNTAFRMLRKLKHKWDNIR